MARITGKWKVKDGKLVKGKRRESVSEKIRQKNSKRIKVVKRGTIA